MQLGSQARKISQDAEIEEVTLFSTTLVAAWERKLVHIKGRWVLSGGWVMEQVGSYQGMPFRHTTGVL
jgi:hypothetical protein